MTAAVSPNVLLSHGRYRAVLLPGRLVSMQALDMANRWRDMATTTLLNENCWRTWVLRKDLAKASPDRGIPQPPAWSAK